MAIFDKKTGLGKKPLGERGKIIASKLPGRKKEVKILAAWWEKKMAQKVAVPQRRFP